MATNMEGISMAHSRLKELLIDMGEAFYTIDERINVLKQIKSELEAIKVVQFDPEYDINIHSLAEAGDHISYAAAKIGEFISQAKKTEAYMNEQNPKEGKD